VRTITTGLLGKRYKAERLKISFSAITGNEFQSSLFGANCKSRGFFTGLQRVARSFDKEKHRFSLEKGAFPTRRHPQGAERKASRSKSGGLPRRETAFARTSLAWSGRGWHYPLWRLIEKPRYLQKTLFLIHCSTLHEETGGRCRECCGLTFYALMGGDWQMLDFKHSHDASQTESKAK